jgi:phosphoribosylanthranilate isomerase
MTFVKICGITNLPDALVAVSEGADALGFNFYRKSPRYVEPSEARRIIQQLPANVLTVGVFVNKETPEQVKVVASEAGVSAFQLHGDESPDYCSALRDSYVIKAFAVSEAFDIRTTQEYSVDAILLDASHRKLRGGTGQVIDWTVAKRVGELGIKMFLAGGLTPENVRVAIDTVNP